MARGEWRAGWDLTRGGSAATRARRALTVILALYGIAIFRDPGTYRWIDALDVAIHETGHLVFSFDGEMLQYLGGTLFQCLVPLIFAVYFWRWQRDRHAASVTLWWLAQNLANVSVYVKDARTQALPLVGGGEHDWAIILGETGLLRDDQRIGGVIFVTGLLVFIGSIWLGWVSSGSAMNPPEQLSPAGSER